MDRRPRIDTVSWAVTGELEVDRPLTAVGSGRGAGSRTWTKSVDQLVTTAPTKGIDLVGGRVNNADSVPAEAAGAIVFDESGDFVGMLSVDLVDDQPRPAGSRHPRVHKSTS